MCRTDRGVTTDGIPDHKTKHIVSCFVDGCLKYTFEAKH